MTCFAAGSSPCQARCGLAIGFCPLASLTLLGTVCVLLCLCAVHHVNQTQANLWLLRRVEFSNEFVIRVHVRVYDLVVYRCGQGSLRGAHVLPPGFWPYERVRFVVHC